MILYTERVERDTRFIYIFFAGKLQNRFLEAPAVRLRPTPFELPFDALTSMLKSTGGLGDLKKKETNPSDIFYTKK